MQFLAIITMLGAATATSLQNLEARQGCPIAGGGCYKGAYCGSWNGQLALLNCNTHGLVKQCHQNDACYVTNSGGLNCGQPSNGQCY